MPNEKHVLPDGPASGRLRETSTSYVGLRMPDVGAAVRFRSRVLGLFPRGPQPHQGAHLGWGTGHHVVDLLPGPRGLDHVASEVCDPGGLEAVRERLGTAGHEIAALDASSLHECGEHGADPGRRPPKHQHVTLATTDVASMTAFYVGVGTVVDEVVAETVPEAAPAVVEGAFRG